MLNSNKTRELVYIVPIDDIKPIPGRDFVECAIVGGWTVMVRKNIFHPANLGIYFEIDSKVPENNKAFAFLEAKHYKIKTQKFKNFYSQGLLMHPSDLGWQVVEVDDGGIHKLAVQDDKGELHFTDDESRFLTKQLGVTYAVAEDNKRKGSGPDKYAKMAKRHPNLFKKKPVRWLMRRTWGKKLMFLFFGKSKDKRNWPQWVTKTDEERVQNMPWVFSDPDWHDATWFATEKIDGSSTTFTIKRGTGFSKDTYYVCSRNVCFDTPEKEGKCYYDTNIYTEMAEKYNIQTKIKAMLHENSDLDFVTIQGETYGAGVQKRDYSIKDHDFMAFNVIFGYKDGTRKRLNPKEMTEYLEPFAIPCVPIISAVFKLPDTCDELLKIAEGNSAVDGLPREGIVFRDVNGERSFKAVSNPFLVKYHGGD